MKKIYLFLELNNNALTELMQNIEQNKQLLEHARFDYMEMQLTHEPTCITNIP